MSQSGFIFDVKRFAIHDGPGIRTTVFFKGCPLDCPWCHNPEGKARQLEFMWAEADCLGCRDCKDACNRNAISFPKGSLLLEKEKCNFCQVCTQICPARALRIVGSETTVMEVMKELEKDVPFYDQSDGGVTFSGGEPLMQPLFLNDLAEACKDTGMHTTLDTCGYAEPESLQGISRHIDLFLYDLKMVDDEKHVRFTGVSNSLILENLRTLSRSGENVIVRYPLIPTVNDNDEDISKLADFVSTLKGVKEVHVLPYHRSWVTKSKGLIWAEEKPFDNHPPSPTSLKRIQGKLLDTGKKVLVSR
ncbi:MAG: glycyl-radical enzyme activating protein [Candidatus Bathyarchaeota archaeon]|nr:MAG: glycyl-radical enzyme activating protein [Candidatus Bathyarchaeota archaeon]